MGHFFPDGPYVGNEATGYVNPSGLKPPELGPLSGYLDRLANRHKNNPFIVIPAGMLVGPAALIDTIPGAIHQAAGDARQGIIDDIKTTNDPIRKGAGALALGYAVAGEGFAQLGNAEAAGQLLGLPFKLRASMTLAQRELLLIELTKKGVRHTAENITHIARAPNGAIVFLESGNARAGLQHILTRHGDDFVRAGIPRDRIADYVFRAATQGCPVDAARTPAAGQAMLAGLSLSML